MTVEVSDQHEGAIDIQSLKGWLPVDAVVSEGRPGLLWMDMQGVQLAEPFFQQTVERLRAAQPQPNEKFTQFDAALQLEKISDSLQPDGFIFHSSRCGSTLIANACKCLRDSIVISEAYAIDKLVARFITDALEDPSRKLVYSILLRAVVNALGQRRAGTERRFFIKFSCCSVTQLRVMKRIWPKVPWLFLYRDPCETIVSNLQNVPEWMVDRDRRILAGIIGSSETHVSTMSREELCARAIGSFYSQALESADEHSLFLSYNQLSLPSILRVIQFFGVNPDATEIEAIEKVSRLYSKNARGDASFVCDIDKKQRLISDLVKEMADKWASEPYRLLEENMSRLALRPTD